MTLARAYAREVTQVLDNSLDQEDIFNRLTDNGQAQGLYMLNGQLYFNGTYMRAGEINADVVRIINLSVSDIDTGMIHSADYETVVIPKVYPAASLYPAANVFPNNGELVIRGFAIDFATGQIYGAFYSEQIEDLQDAQDEMSGDIGGLQTTVSGIETNVSSLQTAVSGLQTTVSGIQNAQAEMGRSISGLQTAVSNIQDAQSVMRGDIGDLQTTVSGLASDVSDLQTAVSGLQSTVSGLQTTVSGLQTTVSGLQSAIAALQDALVYPKDAPTRMAMLRTRSGEAPEETTEGENKDAADEPNGRKATDDEAEEER